MRACPIATLSLDSDHWHLQHGTWSLSRSKLSTPRRQHHMVEMVKSYLDLLPKHQWGRKRVSLRRQGNHQCKHHRPNPQYHQSDQAGSRGASPPTCALARNIRCHQGDALVVSCASGHDKLRLAKWDGFLGVWHVSLAQIPNFQLTYYYPLNDSL